MIRLEKDSHAPRKCPHCGRGYDVNDWGTDYGEPIPNESFVRCPYWDCEKDFQIWTDVIVNVRTR